MHEMSIALSIVDIAEKEFKKSGAAKITELELEIGLLAGIEYDALEFAMQMAVKNTVLEKAVLKLDKPAGLAKCNDCGLEFEVKEMIFSCPDCKGYNNSLIRGKELRVKSLLVDD